MTDNNPNPSICAPDMDPRLMEEIEAYVLIRVQEETKDIREAIGKLAFGLMGLATDVVGVAEKHNLLATAFLELSDFLKRKLGPEE